MAGRIVVYGLLVVAVVLSVPAASHTGLETWTSLAASSTAFVAMALNQFLATRPRFLEGMFGGLDRIYHLHRHLGIVALVLILVHYFITPNFKGKILTSGLNELAEMAAEYGFWIIIGLLGLSLVKKIPGTKLEVPYHLWRQSHRFMGVVFILIAFHQMFIKRPFDGNALLANYLNIFAAIGILSFFYTQIVPFLRRKAYLVTAVERSPAATIIDASPVGRPVVSQPGQFAFLRVKKSGLTEPHPFTLAGRGEEGQVRFAIKPLGDFTKRLRENIAEGDKIQIEGGYGRFRFLPSVKKQIWLAGGIGVTPFLAMADSLQASQDQQVCLVHCVGGAEEAICENKLRDIAASLGNFKYVLYPSKTEGRMDTGKLADLAGFDLDGAGLWFCGPPPLRKAIEAGMKKLGKKFSLVKYELFEFR